METSLFYADTSRLIGSEELRATARTVVRSSSLIRRAYQGDAEAARALHVGFWRFVFEFERAIDKKCQTGLRRTPLQKKFGAEPTIKVLRALAEAVREMKTEEGQHAKHWLKDAKCLGLDNLDGPDISGVRELVEKAYTKELPLFFAVLAGTEYIAEELGAFLCESSAYKALFTRKNWVWGVVHTIPHDDGPSHLEIDLDLARAYSPTDDDIAPVRKMVLDTIYLFGKAADDVEETLAPTAVAA